MYENLRPHVVVLRARNEIDSLTDSLTDEQRSDLRERLQYLDTAKAVCHAGQNARGSRTISDTFLGVGLAMLPFGVASSTLGGGGVGSFLVFAAATAVLLGNSHMVREDAKRWERQALIAVGLHNQR